MIKKTIALLIAVFVVAGVMCSCGGKREVKIYNKTGATINEAVIDAEDGPAIEVPNPDGKEITIPLSDKFDDYDEVTVLLVSNHNEEFVKTVSLEKKGVTEVAIKESDYKKGNWLDELKRAKDKFFNND